MTEEKKYRFPSDPTYSEDIRKLQDSDPASASQVFNPLLQALIENIHYLKLRGDRLEQGTHRRVLAVRERDSTRPDYGLGEETPAEPVLLLNTYTGDTPVAAVVSGTEYDARNMSVGEDVPNGTLILSPVP